MELGKSDIAFFIPQKEPFIMIDNLIEAKNEVIKTDFKILANNIFIEDGVLGEYALIENIAQSSSVGLSVSGILTKTKPENGYLGAISKLMLYDLPKVNETIHTIVTLLFKFENMFLLKGENYLNDKKLMECEIKLVIK